MSLPPPGLDPQSHAQLLAYLVRKGKGITGLDWYLAFDDADPDFPLTREESEYETERCEIIRGLLWHSSVVIVDRLFMDLARLGDGAEIDDTWVLAELPQSCQAFYNVAFTRRFLAVMIDVTSMLAAGWRPLATTAHRLAFCLLIDGAESARELFDIRLEPYWYQEFLDIAETCDAEFPNSVHLPIETTSIEQWFTPLQPNPLSVPYALTD